MLRHQVATFISQIARTTIGETDITVPPQTALGDYAVGCFALAKAAGQSPADVATKLATDITSQLQSDSLIASAASAGPYVNVMLNAAKAAAAVLTDPPTITPSDHPQTILLETFQANPLKEFHIGHVRNAVTGEALRRVLLARGHQVTTVSFMGDVGAHVAKWLWYYQKFSPAPSSGEQFTKWTNQIYAAATKAAADDPTSKDEIAAVNRALDVRDPALTPLWQKFRQPCVEDFWRIGRELEITLDHNFFESDSEGVGKALVSQWLAEGKVVKDQGAIIINLEDTKLGVFLLLKSDGTALYATKDLGLMMLKKEKFSFDQSLVITGTEQDHYFRQLYTVMDRFGLWPKAKNIHVSYGLVTLKEGKMSSRLGNTIGYDDLRDEMVKKATAAINERNSDLADKENVARVVAWGAMKFAMLSIDMKRLIKFDWDAALQFEGDTGPYLQYTYARIQSIKRKAGAVTTAVDFSLLVEDDERRLITLLDDFSGVVAAAADSYAPPLVARYLLDVATAFNHFYHQHKVVSDDPALTAARLLLIDRVGQTLKGGLHLLAIDVVDEM